MPSIEQQQAQNAHLDRPLQPVLISSQASASEKGSLPDHFQGSFLMVIASIYMTATSSLAQQEADKARRTSMAEERQRGAHGDQSEHYSNASWWTQGSKSFAALTQVAGSVAQTMRPDAKDAIQMATGALSSGTQAGGEWMASGYQSKLQGTGQGNVAAATNTTQTTRGSEQTTAQLATSTHQAAIAALQAAARATTAGL